MDKVAMFPTTQSVSNRPHQSLEEKVEKLTRELKKLRCEVAELSNQNGSADGTVEVRSSRLSGERASWPQQAVHEAEFDWEKWARETKARIRGENLDGPLTANNLPANDLTTNNGSGTV